MKKKIQYYVREVYGKPLEYVKDAGDAKLIRQLTGKKTIDCQTRELIHDLSGGLVFFERVME